MRVLHIGKYYPPYKGGIENFMRDLMKAQQKAGISVSALVHHHVPNRPSRWEEDHGLRIVRASLLTQVLYTPISSSFPGLLRTRIRTFRPDLLHLHLPNPSVFWNLIIPEARAVPWVIQWQSDVVPSAIDRRLRTAYRCYRPLEQALLRRAQGVIVASQAYLDSSEPLQRWRSKCRAVPLGVDPERLPRPGETLLHEAESAWKPSALKVLAVGRLTYYKGFDILMKAVARTPGVSVQIVGEGDLRPRLEAEIRKLGLQNRVILKGALSDPMLQAAFAACDVVCLPSLERTEAFGVVLVEAMRYGRVLVVSDIPGSGVGWVVRTGECGFLVPPGDENALRSVFQRLMAQPALLDEMGKRGTARFKERFHIRPVAHTIRRLYDEVMEGSAD
ncbi:MAG: glycosyltransferase [Desulfatiglandaceae bacterium]